MSLLRRQSTLRLLRHTRNLQTTSFPTRVLTSTLIPSHSSSISSAPVAAGLINPLHTQWQASSNGIVGNAPLIEESLRGAEKWWGGLESWLRKIEQKDSEGGKAGAAEAGKESKSEQGKESNEGDSKGGNEGNTGGGGGGGGSGNGKNWKDYFPGKDPSNVYKAALASAFVAIVASQFLIPPTMFGREISFQEFSYELLERGLVDRLEIINRQTALVYLKQKDSELGGDGERRFDEGSYDQDERGEYEGLNRGSYGNREGYGNRKFDERRFDEGGYNEDYAWDRMDQSRSPGSIGSQAMKLLSGGRDNRYAAFHFNIGEVDAFERKLEQVQEDMGLTPNEFIPVKYVSTTNFMSYVNPSLILVLLVMFMVRSSLQNVMGRATPSIFHIGKAKTGNISSKVTFKDVAGLGEAKNEILEFVDFLKKPEKFKKLGAKIPRGALLVGPPGTGKTLLAKATAGEAGVPFFSISGSEFIEMFVGVGPSRVRDLFSQARNASPSIIFIDEIDAIGRTRGGRGGFGGGNDERENTLNALLVEMDGFSTTDNVVVLAGTNRADILDRALLRPGRFDRQIAVEKPDIRGRFDILLVHLANIRVSTDPSHTEDDIAKIKEKLAKKIAAYTPGMSGADLANVCNEAALVAARRSGVKVEIEDFESAVDRVIGGLEKKNRVVSAKDREIVAHHEAGHAVAGWFLKHGDPLLKVSIIPRGSAALGFAQYLPQDRVLQNKKQMRDFMIMALGGRTAEALIYGAKKVTTGAQDDLQRVTRLAYAQVANYGMSDELGKLYFPRPGDPGTSNQFYKPYSEETAEKMDAEASTLVNDAYAACEELLQSKLDQVKSLAQRLLQKEVVREDDLVDVLGPRKYSKPADYDTFVGTFDRDREKRTGKKGDAVDPHTTPPIPVKDPVAEDGEGAGARQKGAERSGEEGREEEEVIPDLC